MEKRINETIFRLLMFVLFCTSDARDRVQFSTWLPTSANGGGEGFYTFYWMISVNIEHCLDGCKSAKICQYVNYEVRTHKCALIRLHDNTTDDTVAVVETKPGFLFGNKSEWNTVMFSECDACSSYGNCGTGDSLKDGKNPCRNAGCGMPSEDFYGNMFSPGSQIRQKCKDEYQTFPSNGTLTTICLENGTWAATDDLSAVCGQAYFNGSYYYIQTVPMSWNDAKTECERLSGHLVDIKTEEEQLFLEGFFMGDYRKIFWTGGNALNATHVFQWSDETLVSAYTHWRVGEPDYHRNDQLCIALTTRKRGLFWHDTVCNRSLHSLCEFSKNAQ